MLTGGKMIKFDPIYFVPTNENAVAITYDDGPTPGVTDKILSVLESRNAKATFFMVGEHVEKYPELAKAVYEAGHEIGIHSYQHKRRMGKWDLNSLLKDFSMAKSAIQKATGFVPTLIRTPYGNVSPEIVNACSELNLTFVGWSLSVQDWIVNTKYQIPRLVSGCVPGSVILFHDGKRVNPDNIENSFRLTKLLLDDKKRAFVTVSSLFSKWDDSLVFVNGNGIRILGKTVIKSQDKNELFVFLHPLDVLNGVSCSTVSVDGKKNYSCVHPYSNASEWIISMLMSENVNGLDNKIEAGVYNPTTDGFKINLGCGNHILQGWDNFDTASRAKWEVRDWEWNKKLPYKDETVRLVLIQHSLQHCSIKDYDRNFSEINRVLIRRGKILIQEADDRNFIWHSPGKIDSDGLIASSTSEPEIIDVLEANGFENIINDKVLLVKKYGDVINRTRRLLKGNKFFVLEGTKK